MNLNNFARNLLPKTIYENLFLLRHLQKLATRDGAYLVETGYIKSIKSFEPVNKEGNPIPWMNYSFIDFLEPRLNQSMNIFEYFKKEGFKELSFTGLKPGGFIVDKTTVFYKKNNVLNI